MRQIKPTIDHCIRLAKYTTAGATGDDCWGWKAATDEHGYGRIRIDYQEYAAHRLAYAVHFGIDPGELDVLHSCDNPSCTNPRHLFLGTHTDNMRDAASKGRLTSAGISRNAGMKNASAKLTDAQIAEIRSLWRAGYKQKRLATLFGVRQGYISMLVNGHARFQPDHFEDAAKALE